MLVQKKTESWIVAYRYSELEKFHDAVKEVFATWKRPEDGLPEFPQKTYIEGLFYGDDPEFVNRRRFSLEIYLKQISTKEYATEILEQYFGIQKAEVSPQK